MPTTMKPRTGMTIAALVKLVVLSYCAVRFAVPSPYDQPWLNIVLRVATVIYCLVEATYPGMHVVGMSFERSLQIRYSGWAVASFLGSIGALITWTPVGYLAASCAFAYWLLSSWMVSKIGLPWSRWPVSPTT
jgi:hypothetical protein